MIHARWELSEGAIRSWSRLRNCSVDAARLKLIARMHLAIFRETDRQGRELYKSTDGTGGARWIVHRGKVLWVGQGSHHKSGHWDADPEQERQRGAERIELTLDLEACRLLQELAGPPGEPGSTPPGDLVGQALRVFWEVKTGRR